MSGIEPPRASVRWAEDDCQASSSIRAQGIDAVIAGAMQDDSGLSEQALRAHFLVQPRISALWIRGYPRSPPCLLRKAQTAVGD